MRRAAKSLWLLALMLFGCERPPEPRPQEPVTFCDGTVHLNAGPCAFTEGLVAAGDFRGLVPNYDSCPAVVHWRGSPGDEWLSVIDASGHLQVLTVSPYLTSAKPSALFVWSGDPNYDNGLGFVNRQHGFVPLATSVSGLLVSDDKHAAFATDRGYSLSAREPPALAGDRLVSA